MLTLYYKPSCPFCQRVITVAQNLNINFSLKDISDDETALAELMEKGGKQQVPFLVDTEKNISMYESSDIIEYIREHYAGSAREASAAPRPRVHVGGSVCESCEG